MKIIILAICIFLYQQVVYANTIATGLLQKRWDSDTLSYCVKNNIDCNLIRTHGTLENINKLNNKEVDYAVILETHYDPKIHYIEHTFEPDYLFVLYRGEIQQDKFTFNALNDSGDLFLTQQIIGDDNINIYNQYKEDWVICQDAKQVKNYVILFSVGITDHTITFFDYLINQCGFKFYNIDNDIMSPLYSINIIKTLNLPLSSRKIIKLLKKQINVITLKVYLVRLK